MIPNRLKFWQSEKGPKSKIGARITLTLHVIYVLYCIHSLRLRTHDLTQAADFSKKVPNDYSALTMFCNVMSVTLADLISASQQLFFLVFTLSPSRTVLK